MDAREIMTKDVVALAPDMSLDEATDMLLHYRIHGAPVAGEDGSLLGVVSFTDLAHHASEPLTVRDIMVTTPVTVTEDTPVEDVAAIMLDEMVRRVIVVRGSQVAGIISASDIVRVFLDLHELPRAKRLAAAGDRRPRR